MYHFCTTGWPLLGGKSRLNAPKWIIKRFGGKPASNIGGVDFRKKDDESGSKDTKSSKIAKMIKKAKQSKGHKIGS